LRSPARVEVARRSLDRPPNACPSTQPRQPAFWLIVKPEGGSSNFSILL
jgi:hypothetical protein